MRVSGGFVGENQKQDRFCAVPHPGGNAWAHPANWKLSSIVLRGTEPVSAWQWGVLSFYHRMITWCVARTYVTLFSVFDGSITLAQRMACLIEPKGRSPSHWLAVSLISGCVFYHLVCYISNGGMRKIISGIHTRLQSSGEGGTGVCYLERRTCSGKLVGLFIDTMC